MAKAILMDAVRLSALNDEVVTCTRCPRLIAHCREIAATRKREFRDSTYWGRPVPGFGDPAASLLIVGLAPAAHGANRTGRMFTGDSSGSWLYEALHRYGFADRSMSVSRDDGLTLSGCYVSAAARCAPPDNKPSAQELANCRRFLAHELAHLSRVRVVLVLGHVAHDSWLRAAGWWDSLRPAQRPPFGHGREAVLPDGRTVLCSFHPSRQNTNTGRLTRDMWYSVFARARELVGTP
jgi:uracil-DNA glycosylase family 4